MKEELLLSKKGVCEEIFVYRNICDDNEYISLKTSKGYMHSYVCVSNPKVSQPQFSLTVLSGFLKVDRVLILGAGLFTNALQVNSINCNARIVVVDIESSLYTAAKKYLKIDEYKNIEFEVCDARDYLEKSKEVFDYIIVDIFQNNAVPGHCITREFFRLIFNRLDNDGALVINTNMPLLRFFPKYDKDYKLVNPVYNLQSALYSAGFKAIYHNDSFNLGVQYIFKDNQDHFFMDTLKSAYREENIDINIKAAIGAINLMTFKVSEKVKVFKPFIDAQKLGNKKVFVSYIMEHILGYDENEFISNNNPYNKISNITFKYFVQNVKEMKSGFEIDNIDYYNEIKEVIKENGSGLKPKDLLSRVCFGLKLEDKFIEDSKEIQFWKYILALNKLRQNDAAGAVNWFET